MWWQKNSFCLEGILPNKRHLINRMWSDTYLCIFISCFWSLDCKVPASLYTFLSNWLKSARQAWTAAWLRRGPGSLCGWSLEGFRPASRLLLDPHGHLASCVYSILCPSVPVSSTNTASPVRQAMIGKYGLIFSIWTNDTKDSSSLWPLSLRKPRGAAAGGAAPWPSHSLSRAGCSVFAEGNLPKNGA